MAVSAASGRAPARPMRPRVQLQFASFEARLVALTLDMFVLLIIAAVHITAGSLAVLVSSDFEHQEPSTTSLNVFWGCAGAIAPALILYFFVAFAWKGQTVGGAVMQLMVIRSNGRPLGVLGAAARVAGMFSYVVILGAGGLAAFLLKESSASAAAAVGLALFACVAGLVMAAFDGRRRTLQDRIAGTIVVRTA